MARAGSGSGWKAVAFDMIGGACAATLRFPVTAILLFALAMDANLSIAKFSWIVDIDRHAFLALLAAAMASLAAVLWCEAGGRRPGTGLIVSIVVALAAFLLVWYADRTMAYEWVVLPALAGLAVVSPFIRRGTAGSFWLFCVRFMFAVVLGGLAMALAAGGISAILLSLTYLFGFDLADNLYRYVWSTTGLFLAPLFGLGRIPERFDEQIVASDGQYMSIGMRALGDFVAAPLLIVYALILHAYAAKVIVAGEAPKNQIGWLVLGYGFCVFGSLLLTAPFRSAARAPMRLLLRIWPFVMPVPLALLFHAASLRIVQYGVTPERYLLVLYGLVASAIVLSQLFRSLRGDIRLIAAIPVFALCLAGFGPQGVVGLSISSQAKRFFALMETKPLDAAIEADAVSALRLLSRHNGLGAVKPESVELEEKPRWRRSAHEDLKPVANAYGLNPHAYSDRGEKLSFDRRFGTERAVDMAGFDLVLPRMRLLGNGDERTGRGIGMPNGKIELPNGEMEMFLLNGEISVKWRESAVRFAIPEDRILELAAAPAEEPPTLELKSGDKVLRLIVRELHGERQPGPKVNAISFTLLLKSRDWK